MRDVLDALEQRLDAGTARGLADAVGAAMRDGALPGGTRLPPIRLLATELGLSPTTVSAAWALLRRSGTIRTDGRRGTVVGDRAGPDSLRYRRTLDRSTTFRLDLSTGVPDPALLPDLRPALRRLTGVTLPGTYLDEPLIPELADVLRADWPYPPPGLMVTDGAMDALELVARTVLQFGDRVVVEQPGFPPILDLLEFLGARVVAVPVDAGGLSVAGLQAALVQPVAAVFLQPRAQNPTGVSLTPARERALAAALRPTSTLVVEDDSAGAVAGSPAMSLGRHLPDRTVHVRSFSKSHGPDLRLAAMSGPPALLETLAARRQLGQGWTSRLLQHLLLGLLTDERSVTQVARAREVYRERRAALVELLAGRGVIVGGDDGINVWLPVLDETAAVVRLASRGIGVAPGSPFEVLQDATKHVRVTVGLAGGDLTELADELASAARAGAWVSPR